MEKILILLYKKQFNLGPKNISGAYRRGPAHYFPESQDWVQLGYVPSNLSSRYEKEKRATWGEKSEKVYVSHVQKNKKKVYSTRASAVEKLQAAPQWQWDAVWELS